MSDDYLGLVSLGPGPRELSRLQDLLDSLSFYQSSNCAGVIVVDDGNHGDNIVKTVDFPARIIVVKNPREGRGWWWEGGLSTGLLAGYHCASEYDIDYVLKLDTDSLVISPFHEKIMECLGNNKSIGMVGSHLQPGRDYKECIPIACGRKVSKLFRPLSVWRRPNWHLRSGWAPRARKIRRYYQLALENGYLTGEACEGGGYVMACESLRRFKKAGIFNDPLLLLNSLTEDVMFSLLVRSCGLDLYDLSGPGKVFRIQLAGLPENPVMLAVDGCSIIHSLKDHGNWREEQTRSFFRDRRWAGQRSRHSSSNSCPGS
ncbi:MAG TPA: hypothetical protein VGD78_19515 [Chthoniobacterales bacterium]